MVVAVARPFQPMGVTSPFLLGLIIWLKMIRMDMVMFLFMIFGQEKQKELVSLHRVDRPIFLVTPLLFRLTDVSLPFHHQQATWSWAIQMGMVIFLFMIVTLVRPPMLA